MPKKFIGENSKAVAAKARKSEKADAEKSKKDIQKEDADWADDDKSVKKKQARKEDTERKRQEAIDKKLERDRLLAEEQSSEKSSAKKSFKAPVKITRAQIQENAEKREIADKTKLKGGSNGEKEVITHLEMPLEENLNRVDIESETATNLDEAIAVLSLNDSATTGDKHPEKRMKAAYEEFENIRLPQLKSENPNLRLSQLKQMLRKEWMKCPDNPQNKKLAAMD